MITRFKLPPKQTQRNVYHRLNKKNHRIIIREETQCFSTAAVSSIDNDESMVTTTTTSNDKLENPHFPNLFKSLDLGPAIGSLPNRVIMGSMHTGLEVSLCCSALVCCFQHHLFIWFPKGQRI